tara:strand:- start:8663 stop:10339 length:1677 start_codon:yes stop_codon:yes gene_type:complete
MSRGDENLDKMFKEAFSGQEHLFEPSFWEGVQPQLAVTATPWYAGKAFMVLASATVIGISSLMISDSTPDELAVNNNQTTEKSTIKNIQTPTESMVLVTDNSKIKTNETVHYNSKLKNATNRKESKSEPAEASTLGQEDIKTNLPIALKSSNTKTKSTASTPILNALHATNHSSLRISNSSSNKSVSSQTVNPISGNTSTNVARNQKTNDAENADLTDNKNHATTNHSSDSDATTSTKTVVATGFKASHKKENSLGSTSSYPSIQNKDFKKLNSKSDLNNEFHAAQIHEMETNDLLNLPLSYTDATPLIREFEPHKPLYSPYTLRIMAGYLWSQPLNNSPSGIVNKASQKNMEISFTYDMSKHWGVQIGVDLNLTNEQQQWSEIQTTTTPYFEYTRTVVSIKDSTWWLGGWYNYPERQDTLLKLQRHNQIDSVQHEWSAQQTVTWIEIPVLATYSFYLHQFTFQVSSGASVGFLAGASGQYIKYGDPIALASTTRGLFNSVQYNFLFRTEIGYAISDNWQLNLRPQLKMNLNSMYNPSAGLNSKYLLYGINAGVAYRF